MGRLKHGELSQSIRAIKWRANKAVQNAAYALEKQGAELIIEEPIVPPKKTTKPTPDAIGVFTDPQPVEIEPITDQAYHCNNCQGTVYAGDEACGVCEKTLNWAGIG